MTDTTVRTEEAVNSEVSVVDNGEEELLPLVNLCKSTLRILIPTDISSLLWMSSQTITLAFVGKYLGAVGSAQYSASIIIFNMGGFAFVQGFGAAIDTLSSQAFGANPKSPEVGEVLQLALGLNFVLGLIISIFYMNAHSVACYVFGTEVGTGVAIFLKYSPLYLFVQIISGVMSKTMYAQKVPEIVAVANFVAACSSPITNYFLTPMGIHGACLSLSATVGLCALTHVLCALYHPKVIIRCAPWPTPKLKSKAAWKAFFRVGVPSLVATCAEWWAFEFQTILAGRISTEALAIHGIAMNLVNLLFSVALGVCVAASVIVGNALGGGRPRRAKQFAQFILVCDIVLGLVTSIMMLAFGRHIATIFSTDEAVISGVTSIIPLVALCHTLDSMQFCLQGIFRGANRPAKAGLVVLATLWGIGVPASAFFVLVLKTGVKGCIGGLIVGLICEIPLLLYWLSKFNWEKLAEEAHRGAAVHAARDVVVVDGDETMETASVFADKESAASRTSSVSGDSFHSMQNGRFALNQGSMEALDRTPGVLEELCGSLHGSFAAPPLDYRVESDKE